MNRAVPQTRLAREAIATLERTNGVFVGVVHQRIAFSEAGSRGESVLTLPDADAAAGEVHELWQAIQR